MVLYWPPGFRGFFFWARGGALVPLGAIDFLTLPTARHGSLQVDRVDRIAHRRITAVDQQRPRRRALRLSYRSRSVDDGTPWRPSNFMLSLDGPRKIMHRVYLSMSIVVEAT